MYRKSQIIGLASCSGLAVCLFFCSLTAYADTHWVNLNGLNQSPYGSYATGAHEIQDAVDVAVQKVGALGSCQKVIKAGYICSLLRGIISLPDKGRLRYD